MDIRKVKKLIELVEASSIAEIEIVDGDKSVRVKKEDLAVVVDDGK